MLTTEVRNMRRLLVTMTILLAGLTFACRHTSQTGYSKLSAVQVADRAKPATLNVITEFSATVEVADFDVDINRLKADSQRRTAGTNPTPQQAVSNIYSTLLADPGTYLVPNGKTRTVKTKAKSLGTGLVITPDGYVVTNAHVVSPDEDEAKAALVSSIKNLVDQDTAELEKGLSAALPGTTLSDEDKERFQKLLVARHAKTAHFVEMNNSVFVVTGYTGSGDDVDVRTKPCKIQKVGKPTPGKDVAICKMEGTDFATIPLAAGLDDGSVRTGADLFVIGFPGVLAFDSSISLPTRLEPTLTAGHVGGIKEIGDEKWKAIQTDASISPGNSGGPALNDTGRVVGLATFTVDGERTQNLNFVVSVDVVQEFLRDLNVTPKQSLFTTKYLQALDAYERRDTRRALAIFQGLSAEHPESSVVRDFVRRLSNGQPLPAVVVSPAPSGGGPPQAPDRKSGSAKIVFILIVGLLAIIIAVVILANRSNN
jgi:S1-C subfamily serine protease